MAGEAIEPIERWTAKRRVALVVSILKGETSIAEAARAHGLTVAEVEDWREKFLLGAENALRSRLRRLWPAAQHQHIGHKIGDLLANGFDRRCLDLRAPVEALQLRRHRRGGEGVLHPLPGPPCTRPHPVVA